MTSLRVLHIDDEPDIREVVELSLGLDPAFSVRSCASGSDALATVADWSPDIILCDVMMPVMDGPATLLRLRECPQTVNTPVVFMTARAQTRVTSLPSWGEVGSRSTRSGWSFVYSHQIAVNEPAALMCSMRLPRHQFIKWNAGCRVPSTPTIAKIANPRAISIVLLRVS